MICFFAGTAAHRVRIVITGGQNFPIFNEINGWRGAVSDATPSLPANVAQRPSNTCEHRVWLAFTDIRGQNGGGTRHRTAPPIDFIEDWQILTARGDDSHPLGGSSGQKTAQVSGCPERQPVSPAPIPHENKGWRKGDDLSATLRLPATRACMLALLVRRNHASCRMQRGPDPCLNAPS